MRKLDAKRLKFEIRIYGMSDRSDRVTLRCAVITQIEPESDAGYRNRTYLALAPRCDDAGGMARVSGHAETERDTGMLEVYRAARLIVISKRCGRSMSSAMRVGYVVMADCTV